MDFKSLANVVTSKVGRQLLSVRKHSPAILFTAGIVGVVSTVVLASRATLKLSDVLDETDREVEKIQAFEDRDYSDEDRHRDILKAKVRGGLRVAVMYTPAVAVGVVSIASLSGAHLVLTRRNMAVTAAYAALDRGYREFQKRVESEYGPEKARDLRLGLVDREYVEETAEGPVVRTSKGVGPNGLSGYAVLFSRDTSASWSSEHFRNQLFLQCQQNYANDLLNSRGYIFLNEVLTFLGLPITKAGQAVGWFLGKGDDHVDFGFFDGDSAAGMLFATGQENSIWLDFNVDGVIWDNF